MLDCAGKFGGVPLLAGLLLAGCALPTAGASGGGPPRVEMQRSMRRMETLDTRAEDLYGSGRQAKEVAVLDVFVHAPGAVKVEFDVVARLVPQIAEKLGADADGDDDGKTTLVRLYVVPGGDAHQAWLTTLAPRQVRALARMEEAERARILERLPWGYTARRKM